MSAEKDKIIKRIKNLLDMADDVASPNEAFIAARRARKLMDQYQITKSDIDQVKENAFGKTRGKYEYKAYPVWMGCLGVSVAKLNDCQSVWGYTSSGVKFESFRGFKSDAIIAKYTFEYLVDRAISLCKSRGFTDRSEKNFYLRGFQQAISQRINEELSLRKKVITTSDGTFLVIMKKQLVDSHFGQVTYTNVSGLREPFSNEVLALNDGYEDGRNTSIDKQIQTQDRKVLST